MYDTDRVRQAQSAYVKEVTNDDPIALIAQVFRFAHVHARRARAAIEQDEKVAKAQSIERLLRAIGLLHASVNLEEGGEVAANLDRLYVYFLERISTANLRNDSAALREVEGHLGELSQAWATVSSRNAVAATP